MDPAAGIGWAVAHTVSRWHACVCVCVGGVGVGVEWMAPSAAVRALGYRTHCVLALADPSTGIYDVLCMAASVITALAWACQQVYARTVYSVVLMR